MNDASDHARHVLVDGGFATGREADAIVAWLEVAPPLTRWVGINILALLLWLRRFVVNWR